MVQTDPPELQQFLDQELASGEYESESALRFLDSIQTKCKQYARKPLMGDGRPDLGKDARCFAVGNSVVWYRPLDDGILVLLVVHGGRDVPTVFRSLFER